MWSRELFLLFVLVSFVSLEKELLVGPFGSKLNVRLFLSSSTLDVVCPQLVCNSTNISTNNANNCCFNTCIPLLLLLPGKVPPPLSSSSCSRSWALSYQRVSVCNAMCSLRHCMYLGRTSPHNASMLLPTKENCCSIFLMYVGSNHQMHFKSLLNNFKVALRFGLLFNFSLNFA